MIQGSRNTISAPSPQTKAKKTWTFSVAGPTAAPQTHDITANSTATYTATYKQR